MAFPANPAQAEEPPAEYSAAASTAAPQSQEGINPFALGAFYDQRGLSLRLDYRIRWDFADVRRAPDTFARTLKRPDTAFKRNAALIASSARFRLFGLGLNPYRVLVDESATGGGEGAAGPGGPEGAPAPAGRHLRFSLDPVFDDLRENLPGDIRREVLKRSFDLAVPSARRSPFWQKEVVVDDLLQLRRQWQERLDERRPKGTD